MVTIIINEKDVADINVFGDHFNNTIAIMRGSKTQEPEAWRQGYYT